MIWKSYLKKIPAYEEKISDEKIWPRSPVFKVLDRIACSVSKIELTLAQTQEKKDR